jgi:hypothetical protein
MVSSSLPSESTILCFDFFREDAEARRFGGWWLRIRIVEVRVNKFLNAAPQVI